MFISFATPQTGLLQRPLFQWGEGGWGPKTPFGEVENCRRLSLALFTFLISRRPVAVQAPLKPPTSPPLTDC